jgi:SOS-response transcriptional repressor LexA
MDELTKTQTQILNYLVEYQSTKGYSPSLRDISAEFNYASPSTAKFHLDNLAKKQAITRIGYRAIRIEKN